MSNTDPYSQTTLNIPSLIAFAVLSFLVIRYFFFSSSSSSDSNANAAASPGSRRRITPEKIDTVATMFPQLARRDIEWDLLRNGGSVQATTEKVLREGRLENPPPNFRASTPPTGTPAPSSSTRPGQNQSSASKAQYADLITRYNLSSKVNSSTSSSGAESAQQVQEEKNQWSSNKNERAELLKRRREEMVLNARRKMEDQQRSS